MNIQSKEVGGIVVCGSIEEAVIDVAVPAGYGELFFQSLKSSGLRDGIRHVEKGSRASPRSSPALTLHVGLLSQTGLTEVHVCINNPR